MSEHQYDFLEDSLPAAIGRALTEEQELICRADAPIVRAIAMAGTGKTTTLEALTERRPRYRFLYAAFSKAVQLEAEKRFPGNVRVRTSHALAFPRFGSRYSHKLKSDLRLTEVMDALDLRGAVGLAGLQAFAYRILETLKAYMASAEDFITTDMVTSLSDVESKYFKPQDVVDMAKRLWGMMCDEDSRKVGMLHDGYLKLFQLDRPKLGSYDYVLFDEAQDATPATLDIMLRQPGKKIFVGDPHQAIFQFRGAIDALAQLKTDANYYLTGSFRFGMNIAAIANAILALKGEKKQVSGLGGFDRVGEVTGTGPSAFIARGNAAVFNHAADCLRKGIAFHFVGGVQGYRLDQIEAVHNLKYNLPVADPFIRSFTDFGELELYANTTDDVDILSRIGVVNKHGREVPTLTAAMSKQHVSADRARRFISTAHKAKGLEWDRVKLAHDFIDMVDGEGKRAENVKDEDINVLYVAATRAKKVLEINPAIEDLLHAAKMRAAATRATAPQPVPAAVAFL